MTTADSSKQKSTSSSTRAPSLTDLYSDIGDFVNLSESEISEIVKELAFTGMDPLLVLKNLTDLASAVQKSAYDMKRDVDYLLIMLITRSNVIGKAIKRMDKTGAQKIKELCRIYGIRMKSVANEKPTLQPNEITLPRLTMVFPFRTATLMYSLPNFELGYNKGEFPLCLCFPAAASIIPKTWKNVWTAHWRVMKNMRREWGIKKTGKERDFWRIAHNSELFNENDRTEYMGKLGVQNKSYDVPRSDKSSSTNAELSDSDGE